ncbi:MAG: hypothetical protein LBP54_01395 [Campylobacteraceae bacterium]|jgi:hypothetical protein|nr:hypothetical protein [Campylobacteraceae bacterium]
MRNYKAYMFHLLIITFIFLLFSGCGYKGDPKYISSDFSRESIKQDLIDGFTSQKSPQREIS